MLFQFSWFLPALHQVNNRILKKNIHFQLIFSKNYFVRLNFYVFIQTAHSRVALDRVPKVSFWNGFSRVPVEFYRVYSTNSNPTPPPPPPHPAAATAPRRSERRRKRRRDRSKIVAADQQTRGAAATSTGTVRVSRFLRRSLFSKKKKKRNAAEFRYGVFVVFAKFERHRNRVSRWVAASSARVHRWSCESLPSLYRVFFALLWFPNVSLPPLSFYFSFFFKYLFFWFLPGFTRNLLT